MNIWKFEFVLSIMTILVGLAICQAFGADRCLAQENSFVISSEYSDILLNDDSTGGLRSHYNPVVCRNADGGLFFWVDDRSGSFFFKIYLQRFGSDGALIGNNVQLYEEIIEVPSAGRLQCAMNEAGNIVLVWLRNSPGTIVAQRFDHNGNMIGDIIQVSTGEWLESNSQPEIEMNEAGEFVIVWGHLGKMVLGRKFDSSGTPAGEPFEVNESAGTSRGISPDIAVAEDGSFSVVWEDNRNDPSFPSDWDIYMQVFDSNMIPQGSNQRVNTDAAGIYQFWPSIATSETGFTCVVWDDRGADSRIMGRIYDSLWNPLGANFPIDSKSIGLRSATKPRIVVSAEREFNVVWAASAPSLFQGVYLQRIDTLGQLRGLLQRMVDTLPIQDTFFVSPSSFDPDVSSDSIGNLSVVWRDTRDLVGGLVGGMEIFAQTLSPIGEKIGSNIRVADDQGTSDQVNVSVVDLPNDKWIVVWIDKRKGESDIYGQLIDESGLPDGPNIVIESSSSFPEDIAVVADDAHGIIVAYQDRASVLFTKLDLLGVSLLQGVRVDEDTARLQKHHAAIASLGSDGFVICWTQILSGLAGNEVWLQRFDTSGIPIGRNILVANVTYAPATSSIGGWPGVGYAVAWDDEARRNIRLKAFDLSGRSLDSPLIINDESLGLRLLPTVANNHKGRFAVAWQDTRVGNQQIMVQLFDQHGNLMDSNIAVSKVCCSNSFEPHITASVDGNFVLSWTGMNSVGNGIFRRSLSQSGTLLGKSVLVNDESVVTFDQRQSSIAANSFGELVAWEDNRRNKGWDIFARFIDKTLTSMDYETNRQLPHEVSLKQNYPNPFNPVTTIKYRLPERRHVTIEIFNVLGRKVKTLVDREESAGSYAVIWNSTDVFGKSVSTGVYLYRLRAGEYVETRKMLLLK